MSDQWPTQPPSVPPTGGWAPPEMPPPPGPGGPTWGPPPGPPAPPSGGPSKGSRAVLLVAIVVVVALTAGGLAWAVTRDEDGSPSASSGTASTTVPVEEDEEEEPTSTTTEAAPSTTADPSGTVVHMTPTGEAELDAAIEDAARFVEETRGLEFKEPVLVEALGDADFVARLRSTIEEEDVDDLATTGKVLAAIGLLPPGTDVAETYLALLDIGVLGFYDPETSELVVRGDEPTLYTQQTIVHELVHALDDQWYDLDRPELDDADDESSFGFSAVVEGNARRVEDVWSDALSSADQQALDAEEYAFSAEIDQDTLDSIPYILFEILGAPYDLGEPLVDDIVDAGGHDLLADAFGEPPVSTEQVIHSDRFLDGEAVLEVDAPTADGTTIDEGTLGELDLVFMLNEAVPSSAARQAADGWGGGRYVAWDDGGQTCLRANVAMDSASDLSELEQAMGDWAALQVDAEVSVVGDVLVFTSCA